MRWAVLGNARSVTTDCVRTMSRNCIFPIFSRHPLKTSAPAFMNNVGQSKKVASHRVGESRGGVC